jgi:hypothetical protein
MMFIHMVDYIVEYNAPQGLHTIALEVCDCSGYAVLWTWQPGMATVKERGVMRYEALHIETRSGLNFRF